MRAQLSGALTAVLLLAAAPVALGAPAAAEELSERIIVRQADLDSEAALANLYARVELAARRICRTISRDAATPAFSTAECRRDAIARAVEGANLAPLSAYHRMVASHEEVAPTPVLAAR